MQINRIQRYKYFGIDYSKEILHTIYNRVWCSLLHLYVLGASGVVWICMCGTCAYVISSDRRTSTHAVVE